MHCPRTEGSIPEGHYETVGGFIMEQLGRVARTGGVVEIEDYRLEVISTDRNRVERVRIIRLPQAETTGSDPAG